MADITCYGVYPTLAVPDVVETAKWYIDCLGFTERFMWGDPVTHGAVWLDQATIHFYIGAPMLNDNWHYFHVDEVDELFAEVRAKGVTITKEPQDYPWGMREFNLVDLNGYHLRFGAGIEHDH